MIKTKDIITKTVLSEREVNLLKRRLNDGKIENAIIFDDFQRSFKIDEAHTEKGLNWLKNQWKTPTGAERKNNPFGYREEEVIDNFSHFELCEFLNNINSTQASMNINNYLPLWNVYSKDDGCFQYYSDFKGIHIIG